MFFIHTTWKDIRIFEFGGYSKILQGRRNKITNSLSFKITNLCGFFCLSEPHEVKVEELKDAGLWGNDETDIKEEKDYVK